MGDFSVRGFLEDVLEGAAQGDGDALAIVGVVVLLIVGLFSLWGVLGGD